MGFISSRLAPFIRSSMLWRHIFLTCCFVAIFRTGYSIAYLAWQDASEAFLSILRHDPLPAGLVTGFTARYVAIRLLENEELKVVPRLLSTLLRQIPFLVLHLSILAAFTVFFLRELHWIGHMLALGYDMELISRASLSMQLFGNYAIRLHIIWEAVLLFLRDVFSIASVALSFLVVLDGKKYILALQLSIFISLILFALFRFFLAPSLAPLIFCLGLSLACFATLWLGFSLSLVAKGAIR